MSADNTIAILETSVYPDMNWGAREYRVQHCTAIGNVYKSKKFVKSYFANSPMFDTYEDAISYAYALEDYIGNVEHGILHITTYRKYLWEELTEGVRAKR